MKNANDKAEKNLFLPAGELEDVEQEEMQHGVASDVMVVALRDMWLDDGSRVRSGEKASVSESLAQLGAEAGFCRRV